MGLSWYLVEMGAWQPEEKASGSCEFRGGLLSQDECHVHKVTGCSTQ